MLTGVVLEDTWSRILGSIVRLLTPSPARFGIDTSIGALVFRGSSWHFQQ